MQRFLAFCVLSIVLCAAPVGAQHAAGPEPRQYFREGDAPRVHGFCYSRRTRQCSSIFTRPSAAEIEQACGQQRWRWHYSFEHFSEARRARSSQCVN